MNAVLVALFVPLISSAAEAESFVVTNTGDAGAGSLRQAILDANAQMGHDVIPFNIPGTGLHTIVLQTSLPGLADDAGVEIDGYSQPGASVNTLTIGNDAVLRIQLDGSKLFESTGAALIALSSNNTIRGLVIAGFPNAGGVFIGGSNNVVQGNFIGVNSTGDLVIPNAHAGIEVQGTDNLIGGSTPSARNVISGNELGGVGLGGKPQRASGKLHRHERLRLRCPR